MPKETKEEKAAAQEEAELEAELKAEAAAEEAEAKAINAEVAKAKAALDAPAPEPAPAWRTWEKKPATLQVREAVAGETVAGKKAKAGDLVYRKPDGAENIATLAELEAAYIQPPPESAPAKWQIKYLDHDAVPYEVEFGGTKYQVRVNGIPNRGLIAAVLDVAHAARTEVETWNTANPMAKKKKIPSFPTIAGVQVSMLVG
jgi:hypothetical protein